MTEAEARVRTTRSLSAVWLVPLAALGIALWLLFQAWQETGPTVEILFNNAAGIAVGKTTMRYRDVVIGEVKDIKLADDFKQVRVYVELDADARSLVSENTLFWVVAPRVSLSGVSGLNTLVSGVYIEMDPGQPGRFVDSFVGLDEPPSVRSYEEGTQFLLRAKELGSLDIGSPVYHRQVKVGEVTGFKLLPEQAAVQIRVFIRAPFDQAVHVQSNFWNVSGIGVQLDSTGVSANIESLTALLAGGVAFSTPRALLREQQPAPEGTSFYLFKNRKDVYDGAYALSYPYLLRFESSVRGLQVGATVELYGTQVGEVTKIQIVEYTGDPEVLVYISLQPERLDADAVPSLEELDGILETLIDNGLRAQLKTSNLLTGSLYVDFVFDKRKRGRLGRFDAYGVIPTLDSEYALISRQVGNLMDEIQGIPFRDIGARLQRSLSGIEQLVTQLNDRQFGENLGGTAANLEEATRNLDQLLAQARLTLKSIDQSIAPDSELYYRVLEMAEDISAAANALERLMEQLERYPNALIRGKDDER